MPSIEAGTAPTNLAGDVLPEGAEREVAAQIDRSLRSTAWVLFGDGGEVPDVNSLLGIGEKQPALELGETLAVYTLEEDALLWQERGGKTAWEHKAFTDFLAPTGLWHHQIRTVEGHLPVAFARSREAEPQEAKATGSPWVVVHVSPVRVSAGGEEQFAAALDEAIGLVDSRLALEQIRAGLVEVPSRHARALYVQGDAPQGHPVELLALAGSVPWQAQGGQDKAGLKVGELYSPADFLRGLRSMPRAEPFPIEPDEDDEEAGRLISVDELLARLAT